MKSWTKLVEFDGDVDVTGAFECPCLDTTGMTEFRFLINILKDTGEHYTGNANAAMAFDGRDIGYYLFNKNWSTIGASIVGMGESYPIPFVIMLDTGNNSVNFNRGNASMESFFGETSKGTKKFIIGFPKGYTGHIAAEIYGR